VYRGSAGARQGTQTNRITALHYAAGVIGAQQRRTRAIGIRRGARFLSPSSSCLDDIVTTKGNPGVTNVGWRCPGRENIIPLKCRFDCKKNVAGDCYDDNTSLNIICAGYWARRKPVVEADTFKIVCENGLPEYLKQVLTWQRH
jgi:hypothetical protein